MTIALSSDELADLAARITSVSGRADHLGRRSKELVEESRRLRGDGVRSVPSFPRFFVIRGEVEGRPVRASWFCGALTASPTLAQRAQLLVDLGERFESDDSGLPGLPADLHATAPAMLTCVRACDRVRVVRFGPLDAAK